MASASLCKPDAEQLVAIRDLVDAGEMIAHVSAVLPHAEIKQAFELSESRRTRGKIVLRIGTWPGCFHDLGQGFQVSVLIAVDERKARDRPVQAAGAQFVFSRDFAGRVGFFPQPFDGLRNPAEQDQHETDPPEIAFRCFPPTVPRLVEMRLRIIGPGAPR